MKILHRICFSIIFRGNWHWMKHLYNFDNRHGTVWQKENYSRECKPLKIMLFLIFKPLSIPISDKFQMKAFHTINWCQKTVPRVSSNSVMQKWNTLLVRFFKVWGIITMLLDVFGRLNLVSICSNQLEEKSERAIIPESKTRFSPKLDGIISRDITGLC